MRSSHLSLKTRQAGKELLLGKNKSLPQLAHRGWPAAAAAAGSCSSPSRRERATRDRWSCCIAMRQPPSPSPDHLPDHTGACVLSKHACLGLLLLLRSPEQLCHDCGLHGEMQAVPFSSEPKHRTVSSTRRQGFHAAIQTHLKPASISLGRLGKMFMGKLVSG